MPISAILRPIMVAWVVSAGIAAEALPQAARPLRYQVDDQGFAITNGSERYNRSLYAGNNGFRVETGDRPEFAFFLPGRGGNLRLGVIAGGTPRWLDTLATISARYAGGVMTYVITDPALPEVELTLTVLPIPGGVTLRLSASGAQKSGLPVFWVFGAGDGVRGRRNGDLRAEGMPLSKFFAFNPAAARTSLVTPVGPSFTVRTGAVTMQGSGSVGAVTMVAEGSAWQDPKLLLGGSVAPAAPVALVRQELAVGQAIHLHVALAGAGTAIPDPAATFAAAEAKRQELLARLVVATPDPLINAASAALTVAADAIWDRASASYMHGAIGWRVPLLGWRGQYAGDAYGRSERTYAHVSGYAAKQSQTPPRQPLPPADEHFRLARSETALADSGNLSQGLMHYDMNLVAVDALFRHLLWTGDKTKAAAMWPMLERHIAWEQRHFRRTFGNPALPLYEAYACIWASDELIYSGGGVTHASAYNAWHLTMMARLATLLGRDPAPYAAEAAAIRAGMQRELWLPGRGWFAETKDLLGDQLVHPDAGIWTFYHTVDSQILPPVAAWQSTRLIDTVLPRIPLTGAGVPPGMWTVSTTRWMPYQWSVNNVALGESAHAALGCWQAGREDLAFQLLRGTLVDSMQLGLCPGNAAMCTASDVSTTEPYRDFADGIGITGRALVEGLFGIAPDALAGTVVIRPGFPTTWEHARIGHPLLGYAFTGTGARDRYVVTAPVGSPLRQVVLQVAARRDRVAQVTVGGKPVAWMPLADFVGVPRIAITAPLAREAVVEIVWEGANPSTPIEEPVVAAGSPIRLDLTPAVIEAIVDPQQVCREATFSAGVLRAILTPEIGRKTVFLRVRQGDLSWIQPLLYDLRPTWEFMPVATQVPGRLRTRIMYHGDALAPGAASLRIPGTSGQRSLPALTNGIATEVELPAGDLPAGTHSVAVVVGGREVATGAVVNWRLAAPSAPARLESVALAPVFNGRIHAIFRAEYRAPRSPFTSLSLPVQGIGGWCHYKETAEIDDRGLRAAAAAHGGRIPTPFGVPFQTPGPGTEANVAFVSRWANHPAEVQVPLTGTAERLYLLLAGSTNPMQYGIEHGEVVVTYADSGQARLVLQTPTNWWPIEQDYRIDGLAFTRPEPVPPRIRLADGAVLVREVQDFRSGRSIPGGAAVVLDLPLTPGKPLASLTLRVRGNDVIVGLLAATLRRAP